MNKEQQETWAFIVEQCSGNGCGSINVASIIRSDAVVAADNELKALRGDVARLKGEAK